MITVTSLAVTAIKGTHLQQVAEIELVGHGARGDRRFFLIDERGRLVNGKLAGELQTVDASFDETTGVLGLTFADGSVVQEVVQVGEELTDTGTGRFRPGKLVNGPWADALSALTGRELRLVMTESAVDRGTKGAISLMSQASLTRLAEEAAIDTVDGRRFRMLIEVDGVDAHTEDGWVERRARIGDAVVQFEGHIGRCRVTTFDPDSGVSDLPTLDLLRGYRDLLDTTEPLAFGIYGRVLEGGKVRVGDTLALT